MIVAPTRCLCSCYPQLLEYITSEFKRASRTHMARTLQPTHCLPYPFSSNVQLLDYITSEFKRIKRKQAMLLGMGKRPDGVLAAEDEKREANRLEPATPRLPQAKL